MTIAIQLKNIVWNHIINFIAWNHIINVALLTTQSALGLFNVSKRMKEQRPSRLCEHYFSDFKQVFTGWLKTKILLNYSRMVFPQDFLKKTKHLQKEKCLFFCCNIPPQKSNCFIKSNLTCSTFQNSYNNVLHDF